VFSYCPALTTINTPKATAFGIETLLGSPQPVMLTLGNTIPTVNGFGAGIPVTGSQLYVPYGRIVSYDADLSGAGDIDGDGLWYGWPLNELPAPAVNPQTGDDSSIIWIIATLVIVLLAIIDIIILKKYTNL